MKKLLKWMLLGSLIAGLLVMAGCGAGSEKGTGTKENAVTTGEKANTPEKETGKLNDLTKENPIKADKEAGTVTFLAQVNGKYLYEPTRHGAVFQGGANGEKAIFRGLVENVAFYDALIGIGAKPGNNMTLDNKETTNVAGDEFDVTVTWEGAGKEYKFGEVVLDSNKKPIIIKFGGNLENSKDKKTGCLICLDSCPVGITSNTTYTYGAVEKRQEVGFTGNKDLLPEDGSLVAITLKLKK